MILAEARQDDQTKEKQRDAYYKEAIQFLNQGDKADSGEGLSPTLAFLTRGESFSVLSVCLRLISRQLFTS